MTTWQLCPLSSWKLCSNSLPAGLEHYPYFLMITRNKFLKNLSFFKWQIFSFPSEHLHRWIHYSYNYSPNTSLLRTISISRNTFFSYFWILKGGKYSDAWLNMVGATDLTMTSPLLCRPNRRKTKSFYKSVWPVACPIFNDVEKFFFFFFPCRKSKSAWWLYQKLMSGYVPTHFLDLCCLIRTQFPTTVHGGREHLPELHSL